MSRARSRFRMNFSEGVLVQTEGSLGTSGGTRNPNATISASLYTSTLNSSSLCCTLFGFSIFFMIIIIY
nr:MAG TPA: hypothetical protein [Caudoviricetes sp.]